MPYEALEQFHALPKGYHMLIVWFMTSKHALPRRYNDHALSHADTTFSCMRHNLDAFARTFTRSL